MRTTLGTYTMYVRTMNDAPLTTLTNADFEYQIEFVAHGYVKTSPWLKSKKLALHWAADFWSN
jgi:hypothetical protein